MSKHSGVISPPETQPSQEDTLESQPETSKALLVAAVGEQLDSDYTVLELPTDDIMSESGCSTQTSTTLGSASALPHQNTEVLVSTALLVRIEALESENKQLKELNSITGCNHNLTVGNIAANDDLVKLYTGFQGYGDLLTFYEFLGPSVDDLTYWGEGQYTRKRQRKRKLSSIDQLLLTLMKLKLNLRNKDIGFRFGISESLVSRYVCTWVCFLYHQLKEIEWTPSTQQVAATLPHAFQEKYPTTFAIIDGSEIFLETLHLQSSTWSSYKQHNTAKFLVACTPNGVISYISPLYVGSISDVQLTCVSGFLKTLEGKEGISIMADRGFTIKKQLSEIGVHLNIPPFLDGRAQLPAEEVKKGRGIASLRIHVERAIGRIKQFSILKGTYPLSMVRLLNQVLCVCAWLTNFQPALIALPLEPIEDDHDHDLVLEHYSCSDSEWNEDVYSCDSD